MISQHKLEASLYNGLLGTRATLSTCGYWALEMWLVSTEMCCKYEVHTEFQTLGKKREYKIFC